MLTVVRHGTEERASQTRWDVPNRIRGSRCRRLHLTSLLLPTYLSSTDPYTLMLDRRHAHAHTAVRARRKHHHQPITISRHPAIAHWRAHHIPPWYKGPYKAKPIRTRGTHSPRYTQPQHSTASTRIQPQQHGSERFCRQSGTPYNESAQAFTTQHQ